MKQAAKGTALRGISIADGRSMLADAGPRTGAMSLTAAKPHDRFVIECASSPRAFGALWPDLSGVAAVSGVRAYPFQCCDHLEIWLETIGAASGVRPFFVKVCNMAGRPLMLLPLGIRRQSGIRILDFLDSGVADYNAPVLFREATDLSPADARALWKAVCRAAPVFDAAMPTKMPERVADFPNPFYALATESGAQSGHLIPLSGVPAEALQSKHDSKEIRRRRARLSELGEVRFRIAGSEGEIEEVFAAFVRQKSQQYVERTGSEGFDVPGQRSYYLSLAKKLAGRGVELACLSVGAEIVATAWCLIAGSTYYYMMCAHEGGRWGKFGPGRILLEDLVGRAGRDGLEAFDLGIGDEEYKLRWNQRPLPLGNFYAAHTPLGAIFLGARATAEALKRRLPPPVRHLAKAALGRKPRRHANT